MVVILPSAPLLTRGPSVTHTHQGVCVPTSSVPAAWATAHHNTALSIPTAITTVSTLIPRIINKKQVIHAAFSMIC